MASPSTVGSDTLAAWGYLPQFARDSDAASGYLFLTWLDGVLNPTLESAATPTSAMAGLQAIDDIVRDAPDALGWSAVMDVARCPAYALPWLAQFVGVRFSGSVVGDEAAMRLAILAKSNFNRGTPAAIASAIMPYLLPGGTVNIIERYPDPYSFTIQISGALGALGYSELAKQKPIYSEIPNADQPTTGTPGYPTYGTMDSSQSEAVVISTINESVPGGLVVTIVFD